MKDKSMTNQESLELISRMIQNTQERFERGAGKPFLIWGYTTLFVSIAVWALLYSTGNHLWQWLWFAIPIIGTIWMLSVEKKSPKRITTFVDKTIHHIWLVLGFCCLLVSLFAALSGKQIPILMIIGLLMFSGQAITGRVIKLRYIQAMGFLGIVLSLFTLYLTGISQILGFAILFLTSMIIPGHIMNAQARKKEKLKS